MSQEFDQTIEGTSYESMRRAAGKRYYRLLNTLAVLAVVGGLLSPFLFISWWFLCFPLFGLACGGFALWNMLNAPEETTGFPFAIGGIVLCLLFALAGGGWQIWSYYGMVPKGYQLVNFDDMRLDPKTGKLPPEIVKLGKERRKIFLKGYMYQGRQLQGIKDFVLVRTLEHCKFCSPQQNPTDMIDVHLVGDLKVAYRIRPVRVGGILYVNENFAYGELPYYIEADVFR